MREAEAQLTSSQLSLPLVLQQGQRHIPALSYSSLPSHTLHICRARGGLANVLSGLGLRWLELNDFQLMAMLMALLMAMLQGVSVNRHLCSLPIPRITRRLLLH